MNRSVASIVHLPQSRYLLGGVAIGYLGFVVWLGVRAMVLVSGMTIAGVAIAVWYWQLQSQSPRQETSADLLHVDVFDNQIRFWDPQIPVAAQSCWQAVQQQAKTIQQIARQIAQRESPLIPDLLETLHTVLDLVEQLAQALQVQQQVQISHYQDLAQQQVQRSLDRLQATQQQLQALHDQLALAGLGRRKSQNDPVLSAHLQTLILDNENGLLENTVR